MQNRDLREGKGNIMTEPAETEMIIISLAKCTTSRVLIPQPGKANEIKMERKSLDKQFSLQFALVSDFGKTFALALATDSDRNS